MDKLINIVHENGGFTRYKNLDKRWSSRKNTGIEATKGGGMRLEKIQSDLQWVKIIGAWILAASIGFGGWTLTRFDNINTKFDTVNDRFSAVQERFNGVDVRLAKIETRLDGMKEDMDRRFDTVDKRFDDLQSTLAAINNKLDTKSKK
jgi:flagellar capping protein FliD